MKRKEVVNDETTQLNGKLESACDSSDRIVSGSASGFVSSESEKIRWTLKNEELKSESSLMEQSSILKPKFQVEYDSNTHVNTTCLPRQSFKNYNKDVDNGTKTAQNQHANKMAKVQDSKHQ